jgi:hypothetical protein
MARRRLHRLALEFALGLFFLAVLPIVKADMRAGVQRASVGSYSGGASIHYKNSSWPALEMSIRPAKPNSARRDAAW